MALVELNQQLAKNRQAFQTLVQSAQEPVALADQWLRLEAAHIVGQRDLKTHTLSHYYMLKLAVRTRDWRECAGQLLRLLLVPLGHLTGRLPMGNTGRATVSAFAPMPVRSELRQLIARAREDHGEARSSLKA